MKKRTVLRFALILCLLFSALSSVVCGETKSIDLNLKNSDIKDVLRALADQQRVNLIIDNDISGKITINLSRLSFKDALDLIVKNNGLTYQLENNVYHISKSDYTILNVKYQEGLLTVEAKEAKVSLVFERLARECNINLIIDPQLQQERITTLLTNLPPGEMLQALLNQSNCYQEVKEQLSYIHKRTTPPVPMTVTYQNNLLTVDAQNVPVAALARELTEKTGVSVVPEQNLSTTISVFFKNLSLADGLNTIGDTNNLLISNEGQSWRISRKTGSYRIKYSENLLTVDADAVDVNMVMNEIARQSGIAINLAKEVRGTVTAHFQKLPLDKGLQFIAEPQGWVVEKQPKYYTIRTNTNANPNIRIAYDGEKEIFDLEVQSAPITAVLSEMARRANLNIVVFSQVNWTVNNVRLQDMKFNQILDFLLKGTIFTYKMDQNTYLIGDGLSTRPENSDLAEVRIYPIRYLKAEQLLNTLPPVFPRQSFVQLPEKNALIVTAPPAVQEKFVNYLKQVDIDAIEDRTEVFKIKHLKAEDVLKLFPPSIPKNDVIVIKEANALAVTGPQNTISEIRQYIEKVDQVNPMIMFDILVLSITDSKTVDWNPANSVLLPDGQKVTVTPEKGEISIGNASLGENILTTIKLLVSKGKAKILQNPTISTLNGYQVNFNVSTKRNYKIITTTGSGDNLTKTETVKTFDSGLYITITPWVSANNQITMEIKPKFSEFGGLTDGLPETIERSTESTIRVADREMIVISGLKNTRKVKNTDKIPVLGDIPLLGYLFTKSYYTDNQDEYFVLITPYLVFTEEDKAQVEQEIRLKFGQETLQEWQKAKE
ncbi:MAG TPA: secretin and TonB N-terminal domain-containing protein [Bacillota bacterium]|nr:secretin and TonB N-terminal domain-containing protein [Bacillota bacterium]